MRRRWLAGGIGVLCGLLSVAALATVLAAGWSFDRTVDAFVPSNIVIGLSFGLCGALIAFHRPGLPLGWLYAAGGVAQLLSATAAPLAQLLHDADAPTWVVRLDLTVFNWAWPLHIGVALPLSLLLLPDGRLVSPRWRVAAVAVVVTAPLFVAEIGLSPLHQAGLPEPYLTLSGYSHWSWLWSLSEMRWTLSVLVGLLYLAVRYRSGDERVRRQLLWLLGAAVLVLAAVTPWALIAGTPLVVLFAIPLLPAAVAIAVLRHQLLDIRLVVARGATYVLLSGLVLGVYAGLVVVLSGVVSALVVALLALPLRSRLQSAVDRLLYGDRADPLQVASRVGKRLAAGLDGTLEEVRSALRLPYVGVEVDDTVVAAAGERAGAAVSLPLGHGMLVVGLRRGEKSLAAADERVLALLSGPLSTAVDATRLSEQVQLSRERLVLAHEEERRRLRRDLHDGLGPLLTGVALSADAAANLAVQRPAEAMAMIGAVRTDSRTAIAEVRRIVEDLRPPALDELGLVAALQERAAQTGRRLDGAALQAVVSAPRTLPPLPAAVEVAAYRIVTEALTNAVRHSAASCVRIHLQCDDALRLEVHDDGPPADAWVPGVGITGMLERVAELGGRCEVGPSPAGGRVQVSLPLVLA